MGKIAGKIKQSPEAENTKAGEIWFNLKNKRIFQIVITDKKDKEKKDEVYNDGGISLSRKGETLIFESGERKIAVEVTSRTMVTATDTDQIYTVNIFLDEYYIAISAKKDTICCSFCGKSQKQAVWLIAGPNGIFICSECVEVCNKILKGEIPVTK